MKLRSRSVFQNYQNFQAWQELPEINHCNLLQRLNKNLSSYQNKYKKYMNVKQNQFKQFPKLPQSLQQQNRQYDNGSFLPQIHCDHNFIRHSQNITKQKVIIAQHKQTPDQQIFCDRSNNHLKFKTISFQKNSKHKLPIEKRKLSLHQPKHNIQKCLHRNDLPIQEKQNIQTAAYKIDANTYKMDGSTCKIDGSTYKLDITNKMEGYKQLRYRLKKAANKSRMFHEQKNEKIKLKDQQNIKLLKPHHRKISSNIRQLQQDYLHSKFNQFSDKKFYQQNIKQKTKLQR